MKVRFMRGRAVLFTLLFFSGTTLLLAQTERTWQDKMNDPNVSFWEVQQDFKDYWVGKQIPKGKGYKQFKRWEYIMEQRVDPQGNRPAPDAIYQAMQAQPEMFQFNNSMPGSWTYIGNTSIPSNGGGVGRVNSVRQEPGSTTTFYACAPAGGLWKTTNTGTSWSMMNTDFLASIGISDIAIDPSNPNILYIATGDGDAGDTYSLGVLKSTDGGNTWATTGLSWNVTQNRTTSRILIHPSNSNIVIVATSNGVFRSINAGNTWTQTLAGSYKDIEFKPGDPNTMYACGTSFYRSTDNGATWTNITSGVPGSPSRLAIAVSAANTGYVYLLAGASNQGLLGVYRSTDSGLTFSTRATSPNLLGWDSNGGDAGGQAWYDLAIECDQEDAEVVWTGGVNIWKSTNGGTNWSCNGHWYGDAGIPYVHADIHCLNYLPGTNTLLVGCDGGVFMTTNNGTTYSDVSSNLQIGQQYRLGVSQTNSTRVITGWQDNGTNLKNGVAHSRVIGGDGMECAIDPTNANIMYGELYYGWILKSTNGGASFSTIVNSGGTGVDEDGAWVTPYVLGTNPNHLFVGKSRVYKSTDGGGTFTAMGTFGSGNINQLAVAASNNDVIYASKGGTLYRTTNGNTFNAISGLPGSNITSIAVHPTDPDHAWVTVSNFSAGNKIYETTNGGGSWTNISINLPNIPATSVVFHNNAVQALYVGTDAGVYYKDNTLSTWIPYMNNLPNVIIGELEIQFVTNSIVAATYGRGLWSAPLYTSAANDLAVTGINLTGGGLCDPNISAEIIFTNIGTNDINGFTYSYQVVGQPLQNGTYTGIIPAGQSVTIAVPPYNYGTGSFQLIATITSVNGGGLDDDNTNNSSTYSYTINSGPSNDLCSGAIAITVNGGPVNADNSDSCANGPNPSCGGSQIQDVWYSFVYTGGNITIQTTLGSNADTRLAVYSSCGATQMACNDDASGIGLASRISLTCSQLVNGQTYYIQAGGFDSGTGTFTVNVTSTTVSGCTNPLACNYNPCATTDNGSCILGLANDNCITAAPLTMNNTIATTNVGACSGTNPTCGGSGAIVDIWYSFVYTGGTVTISTQLGSLTDTRLSVYGSCGGSQIICNDDISGSNFASSVTFTCGQLILGNTYYVQVGGFNAQTGTFNIITTQTFATDVCDGIDNDCDGQTDEDAILVTYYQDQDGDGYGHPLVSITSCSPVGGYVTNNTDCNDNNAAIHPGISDICDGIDNDCDGITDENATFLTYYQDLDGDGFGNALVSISSCSPVVGYVANNTDCNDNNAAIRPGVSDICDGIDNDCDGLTDENATFLTYYQDQDGDGFGNALVSISSCSPVGGYVTNNTDCNDTNAAIHPGVTDICDGIDNDCDGTTDENATFLTYYQDQDGDGFGNPLVSVSSCTTVGGYVTNNTDCNDSNGAIHPGVTDICDGIDNDCDGLMDEDAALITYYQDLDGDNYGNTGVFTISCTPVTGFVTANGDCNDNNASIYPTAPELCNGIDDDCNGLTDDNVATLTYYADADNDGYGDPNTSTTSCSSVPGYVLNNTDCNDNDGTIHPGVLDTCDSIDNDCDGLTDEDGVFTNYYADADGDGFGNMFVFVSSCSPVPGYVMNSFDCDDNNFLIHPGVEDFCDGIDNDCDGTMDEDAFYITYYADMDGDGFGEISATQPLCSPQPGYVLNGLDCNDANANVNPNATELCNGIDDDCDGLIDEGCSIGTVANDDQNNSQWITVGPMNGCNSISGTLLGATLSANPGATCVTGEDVWYAFMTPVPGVRIQCTSAQNNILVELHDNLGNMINVENVMNTLSGEILNYGSLTEGATYYARVRNYDSSQGIGSFNLCITRLEDSRCDYGPGPYNLCQVFKADYTAANQYVFKFTNTLTNTVHTKVHPSDILVLSTVPGLQYGQTYNLTIDAVYNVLNAAGNVEPTAVTGNEPCTVMIGQHANLQVRAIDACPVIKQPWSYISATPWICGVSGFQWEFIRTAPTAGGPYIHTVNAATSMIQLSVIPGIATGQTYSVRIRPIFPGINYGNWSTVASCVQVGAPASMVLDGESSASEENKSTINASTPNASMMVYPNPVTEQIINVSLQNIPQGSFVLKVMDMYGKVIHTQNISVEGSIDTTISLNNDVAAGIYFLEVVGSDVRLTEKIVIE